MDMILSSAGRVMEIGGNWLGQCPGFGPGGYGHMGYYGYGGHFMGILLVILLVVVVYLAVRTAHLRKHGDIPVDTPLDILKKRYARGEITKEQYDAMKPDLKD